MTNEIQIFNSQEFGSIRSLMIEDDPWLVGKDVADALGYANASKAVIDRVEAEDKRTEVIPYSQNGKTVGRITLINESGLYSLILSSKLPAAKKFKRWVTSEVLPTLRKTGKYEIATPTAEQRQLTVDDYIRAASIIAGCRNERLPVVVGLLEQGGIQIPSIREIRKDQDDRDTEGKAAEAINLAINDYGMSASKIAKWTGLQTTQITRIRTGQTVPTEARAKIICDAIEKHRESA